MNEVLIPVIFNSCCFAFRGFLVNQVLLAPVESVTLNLYIQYIYLIHKIAWKTAKSLDSLMEGY